MSRPVSTSSWSQTIKPSVEPFQVLYAVDIRPGLRERNPLALPPPAVDVVLARVVGGERRPLVPVLVQQMPQVPRPVADVDLRVVEILFSEPRSAGVRCDSVGG